MTETAPPYADWRRQYRLDRYLEGLSDDELALRFTDCLSNQLILVDEGKIGASGIDWLQQTEHVLQEYSIRGRGFPPGQPDFRRFRTSAPCYGRDLAKAIRKDYPGGTPKWFALFKYGQRKYLRPFVHEGFLRLMPASKYNEVSLTSSIADCSLGGEQIDGATRTRYRAKSDYYCYSSAWLHSDRLIGDFAADCVVAITDPHEFFVRLSVALNDTGLEMDFDCVRYVDPLFLAGCVFLDPAFTKHMRFAYQFEHRVVVYPQNTETRLDVQYLRLGSLNDIARFYGA